MANLDISTTDGVLRLVLARPDHLDALALAAFAGCGRPVFRGE